MYKIFFTIYFLIIIPMAYTPHCDLLKYSDYPPIQIKQEKTNKWFVFKERKRYFHRRFA